LPVVFAACSNARDDEGDVPDFIESIPESGMATEQPSGNEVPAGDITETPPPTAMNGGGESLNPVTPLEPPSDGSEMAGGAETPVTEPVPFTCVLPELPDNLQDLGYFNEKLPDPFTFLDGTKVTTKEQWDCRRKEILAIADKYLYGPVPATPDAVTGTVNGGAVTINVTVAGRTDSFTANIGAGSDVIALNLSGGVIPAGSRALSFEAGFGGKSRLFTVSARSTPTSPTAGCSIV
jgi:hypothetical protein